MDLELDHVFVCTAVGAPESALLLAAGFTEGAGNVHHGQGTACRRFFFGNAYLELLWVHDEGEARTAATAPTRLWERWQGRADAHVAPFGVCVRTTGRAPPPFPTWIYRPEYLPPDVTIPVAVNSDDLREPMLFLPPGGRRSGGMSAPQFQPTIHANGVRELEGVEIAGALDAPSDPLSAVAASRVLVLRAAASPCLALRFDSERAGQVLDLRPTLPLVLRW